jgi:hypothetical protein
LSEPNPVKLAVLLEAAPFERRGKSLTADAVHAIDDVVELASDGPPFGELCVLKVDSTSDSASTQTQTDHLASRPIGMCPLWELPKKLCREAGIDVYADQAQGLAGAHAAEGRVARGGVGMRDAAPARLYFVTPAPINFALDVVPRASNA